MNQHSGKIFATIACDEVDLQTHVHTYPITLSQQTYIYTPCDHHITPHIYTDKKVCSRENKVDLHNNKERDTLLTNEKRRYNYLFWVDLYGANKVREGGSLLEVEKVSLCMHV